MMKKARNIIELQFELKIKLYDQILEKVGDLRKEGFKYQEISEKMKMNNGGFSKFINGDPGFIEGLKCKTLANYLNNLGTIKLK